MEPQAIVTLSPVLQFGFAGYALIQLLAGVWLGVKLVNVLRDNVAALTTVAHEQAETRETLRADPCRMTVEQLRELVHRLQPQV